MSHNQIIIIEKPTFIHLRECCLEFEQNGKMVARVLPEDIDCLILHYTSTITARALAALAENRATVTILDRQQLPLAHWQPPKANYKKKQRLINLLALSGSPLGERLWQRIVKAKITSQAETLREFGCKSVNPLLVLSQKVEAGDASNIEAQAARVYWTALFDKSFRRVKRGTEEPINQHLNFGYGVIRSLIAKWLCGHGIALEWGLHHENQNSPLCLVDDLIEPYRFTVDRAVKLNLAMFQKEISPESKKLLLESVHRPLRLNGEQCRLPTAVDISCASLGRILDRPSKAAASWLTLPYV